MSDYKAGFADGQIDALEGVIDLVRAIFDSADTPDDLVREIETMTDDLDAKVDALKSERS